VPKERAEPSGPEPERVVRSQAPPEPAAPEPDHLSLAAVHMERGNDAAALPHLLKYVRANPQATMIRAYLAELHWRLGQHDLAQRQYERFARDAASMTGAIRKHRVHAHTRLMEIAQQNEDRFAEHLHRGIGLLLLVEQWEGEPDPPDAATREPTLCKAVEALKEARSEAPHDPRGQLYLGIALEKLGQPSAAQAALRGLNSWTREFPEPDRKRLRDWQPAPR
jgi:tetratricopeptide (TPR) repeat protein